MSSHRPLAVDLNGSFWINLSRESTSVCRSISLDGLINPPQLLPATHPWHPCSFAHLYEAVLSPARQPDPSYGEDWKSKQRSPDISRLPKGSSAKEQEVPPALQYIIPPRFAQVVDGIYRSPFPDVLHLDVYDALGVKTLLSLVGTEYAPCNQYYVHRKGITVHTVPVVANEVLAIKTPDCVVNRVLTVMMSTKNHPIVVHCSDGQNRVGCMIACFRKVQGWALNAIIAEYRQFAGDYACDLDEDFIKAYNPHGMKRRAARVHVATWVANDERLTSNTADERPLLVDSSDENEDVFLLEL